MHKHYNIFDHKYVLLMDKIKESLKREFKVKDLGEPKEFLGIKISRDRKSKTLELNQKNYINKALARFGFEDMHPQRTPMVTTQVMNKERREREDECSPYQESKPIPYREAIGTLLYLACATRPDIAYAVNVLSRHQSNPTINEERRRKTLEQRERQGTMVVLQ